MTSTVWKTVVWFAACGAFSILSLTSTQKLKTYFLTRRRLKQDGHTGLVLLAKAVNPTPDRTSKETSEDADKPVIQEHVYPVMASPLILLLTWSCLFVQLLTSLLRTSFNIYICVKNFIGGRQLQTHFLLE